MRRLSLALSIALLSLASPRHGICQSDSPPNDIRGPPASRDQETQTLRENRRRACLVFSTMRQLGLDIPPVAGLCCEPSRMPPDRGECSQAR
jgi:hypothetical protein